MKIRVSIHSLLPPHPPVKPPPDRANSRVTPPPKRVLDDHVDIFNKSQELLVEGDDQRRLVNFRSSGLRYFPVICRGVIFLFIVRSLQLRLRRPASLRSNQTENAQPAPPPPSPRCPAMGHPGETF